MSFDPAIGGRRAYGFNGSSGSPNFNDTPGVTWPGNPYTGIGAKIQARLTAANLEGINGGTTNHFYEARINGVLVAALALVSAAVVDTGFVDIANTFLAGQTVDFLDWGTNPAAGGSAFTGAIVLSYRYVPVR